MSEQGFFDVFYICDDRQSRGISEDLWREATKYREEALDYLRKMPKPRVEQGGKKGLSGIEFKRNIYIDGTIYHVIHISDEGTYVRRDHKTESLIKLIEQKKKSSTSKEEAA